MAVVSTTPWPVLDPLRVVAVVPTTVQRTPATPMIGVVVGGVVAGAVVVVAGVVVVVAGVVVVVGEVVALDDGVVVGATRVVEVVDGEEIAPSPSGEPARHETPER